MSAVAPTRPVSGHATWLGRALERTLILYLPLALVVVFLLIPFYWMVVTSLKPNSELYNGAANPLYVQAPSLEHFVYLFAKTQFLAWTINTFQVSILATAISLFFGVPAGYALAKLRFRGAGPIGLAVFITYLVPTTLLFIPMIQVINRIGLLDSIWALVVVYPTFLLPFCTWLMSGYFKTIPAELEECARIDGASRIVAMLRIAFPLAMPGIVSAGIFCFTLSWNEFIYALTFIQSSENKTVPVGVLTELVRSDVYEWGALMAGALIGSLPVVILYSFFVEHYVSSMTGAVKE